MLIPYRVKNPWKKFPFATLSIIAVNVLVYLLTTEYGLFIREDVVDGYAFQIGVSPLFTMVTAMFLHGDIFHIAGNMLFFWVFAPPVEDRLGIPRFLLVYFAAGVAGDLLQAILDMTMTGGTMPGIGASGCIMGVMGAYWYLFSWSTVCVFYWLGWFWRGVWEVDAFWIIGLFILLDVAEGFLSGGSGGVANFAHVGGGAAGALICLALRCRRDTEEVSRAKATQAEMKDLNDVPLIDLDTMRRAEPQRVDIIRAMLPQAIRMGRTDLLDRAFAEAGPGLIDQDPKMVAKYIFQVRGDHRHYKSSHLMRMGRFFESENNPSRAIEVYQLIRDAHPAAPETEQLLFRLASCYWEKLHDAPTAKACLQELLTRYPFGSMEYYAKTMLRQIDGA